jgi:hypothetical protein
VQLVTFFNSAASATTLSWTADSDYSAIGCAGVPAVISNDPAVTYNNWVAAPPTTQVKQRWVLESGNFWNFGYPLDFPISKGEKIYCAITATIGPTYLLLLEPIQL